MRALRKPWLVGEFGTVVPGRCQQPRPRRCSSAHGPLGRYLARGAGTGMTWWWDTYVDPLGLYGQFAGAADFLRGEDVAAHGFRSTQAELSTSEAAGLLLQAPERVLGWVKSSAFTYRSVERQVGSTSSAPEFPMLQGITITISGLVDGPYEVEWWDTGGEGIFQRIQVMAVGDVLSLPVPPFAEDIAFKIARSPSS